MQQIRVHTLRYFFSKNKSLFFSLLFLAVYSTVVVFAAPPITPYTPQDNITDPGCAPGSTNCFVSVFPDQTGNGGKFLTTNGTVVSWASVAAGGLAIGDAVTSGTAGSILFVDASGNLAEDNTVFFWDETNDRLGLGDTTPLAAFTVGSGDLFQVNSSGAIAAATGITSSGTINFSGLTASKVIFTDGSKNLTSSGTVGVDQGGTGLTSIGTSNQILGVNNAGTGLEYKTVSVNTAAVANDVGVTLSGANAIVINLPTASASVRGVLSNADWTTFNGKENALTFSTGLTRNTNTITSNLSTGVSGGQSVIGGTASGENLTLTSTSNGIKGNIYLGSAQTSFFNEVDQELYIVGPQARLVRAFRTGVNQGVILGVSIGAAGVVGVHDYNTDTLIAGFNTTNSTYLYAQDNVSFSASAGLVQGARNAGGSLTFSSTSDVTKGKIFFGTSAYDEATNRLGIGLSSPTTALDVLGESLTGSSATSAINIAQTWNTTGTPTAIKLNITDTASNAASKLIDLQIGGISKFLVDKNGIAATGITSSGTINFSDLTASKVVFTDGSKNLSSAGTVGIDQGGTGLTSLGTANQILGVNNAGTGLEYKTVSVNTAAIANDVGVTLSGANAIVINLPTASASVRGVLSNTDWTTFNAKENALTFSTGLTRNMDTITANLSTGISGGQSVIGGTAAGENLTLSSTTNATKGLILFGTSAYDEVNDRLGIGINSPSSKLHVASGTLTDGGIGQRLTATMPSSWTSGTYGMLIDITSAGSSNTFTAALRVVYGSAYSGSAANSALSFYNSNVGTGTFNVFTTGNSTPTGNSGFAGFAGGTTTGTNYGGYGEALGGNINVGLTGKANTTKNSAVNIGVLGIGRNTGTSPTQIGGHFSLGNVTPTWVSAALVADNGDQTSPIQLWRDNGTTIATMSDGGLFSIGTVSNTPQIGVKSNGVNDLFRLEYSGNVGAIWRVSTDGQTSWGASGNTVSWYEAAASGAPNGATGGVHTAWRLNTTTAPTTNAAGFGFLQGTNWADTAGFTATSGNINFFRIKSSFAPTSGTADFRTLYIDGTLNQTGGANGITRGIYIDQTLTSASDYRAIDIARGRFVQTVGTQTGTQNGFFFSSTLPSAGDVQGARFVVTSAGTGAANTGMLVNLNAGYSGSSITIGISGENAATSTGNDLRWGGNLQNFLGNSGLSYFAYGTTTGLNVGAKAEALRGNLNVGGFFKAAEAKNSATNIGVIGQGRNTGTSPIQIGGFFTLRNSAPTYESGALIADNGDQTSPIFLGKDNGTTVFNIIDGGNVGIGPLGGNPAQRLHVLGDAADTTVVSIQTSGGNTCDFSTVTGTFSCASDIRLKNTITSINGSSALEKISGLNPVLYHYNWQTGADPLVAGFIAQEYETIFPELTSTNTDGYKMINQAITPYMVKAIQELNIRVTALDEITGGNPDFTRRIYAFFDRLFNRNEICVDDETCLTRDDVKVLINVARNQNTPQSPQPIAPVVTPEEEEIQIEDSPVATEEEIPSESQEPTPEPVETISTETQTSEE